MCICMYADICIWMCVCMIIRMYMRVDACMYVYGCMYVDVCMYVYFNEWRSDRVLVRLGLNTLRG